MEPRRRLALALLAFALVGCRPASESSSTRAGESQKELDRLRSLPYLGYATEDGNPGIEGVVAHDRQRSQPGFSLYSIYARSRADLIDAEGKVVRSWSHPPSRIWSNCDLLPNGDLLVVGADGPGYSNRYLLRMSWKGDVIWKRSMAAHHDVEVTPRDQILSLTLRWRPIPEISGAWKTRDDQLTLLDHSGRELESISLYEVFSSRPDLFEFQHVAPTNTSSAGGGIDLFHANSIEWMRREHLFGRHSVYDPRHVLVSVRHQDVVAIINADSRELVWVWGHGEISGPHDAQLLEDGHILVFDNGLSPERQWSRVIELDPLSRTIVWEYRAPTPTEFFTKGKGSSQRLANGNTLIASSDQGRAFEVTPTGEIVWDFYCPYRSKSGRRATIVRMKRYDTAYIERIEAVSR